MKQTTLSQNVTIYNATVDQVIEGCLDWVTNNRHNFTKEVKYDVNDLFNHCFERKGKVLESTAVVLLQDCKAFSFIKTDEEGFVWFVIVRVFLNDPTRSSTDIHIHSYVEHSEGLVHKNPHPPKIKERIIQHINGLK